MTDRLWSWARTTFRDQDLVQADPRPVVEPLGATTCRTRAAAPVGATTCPSGAAGMQSVSSG